MLLDNACMHAVVVGEAWEGVGMPVRWAVRDQHQV